MTIPRAISSTYIEWSKLCSAAKYNLATSSIQNYPLAELQVSIDQLEINGPSIYGYEPLQERLARKYGVPADCVVATQGTGMANHLAMAAILEPGDDVLIEQPTYAPIVEVASWFRANILRFPRRAQNNYQADPDELQRCITPGTRLICLANLHNPSGALIGEALLARVGEIAASVGARVLVDEVYLDLVFDPPQRSSFHLGDNFVVTSSLTKAYGLSGLRCGWILARPELAKRIWRLNDLFGAPAVHPGELLSVIALDRLEQIDARARRILDINRAALDAFFQPRKDLAGFHGPWGTIAFPQLKHGSVDEFFDLLYSHYETSVVPGRFFEMPNHFRIGIGGDPAMTAEGLQRLAAALEEYGAARA